MGKIKRIIGSFVHAPDRFDLLAARNAETNERIDRMENVFLEQLNRFRDQLCEDRELLSRLNRGLSIAPTVWGDPARLEIDETAKVFTCFFNTNSGRISVGEAAFAGSGVSILAGSHDPRLTGCLRRDAEMTEGCDIRVGKGVWLASGCTLLGPCSIGDNAVIAAGAVVIPGTEVPPGTIWGGVPARQIGTLDLQEMNAENPAVREAFERSGGILYADGWGERIPGILPAPGHRLYKKEALLLTDHAAWRLAWRKEGTGKGLIRLKGPAGEETIALKESEGETEIRLPVREGELGEVALSRDTGETIFMAMKALGKTQEPEGGEAPAQAEADPETVAEETGEVDIEAIMEEIREEARRHGPYPDIPEFDTISKRDEMTAAALREQLGRLKEDFAASETAGNAGGNPLKRLYRKLTVKATRCATDPLNRKMTETGREFKAILESAAEVIEKQQEQIDELTEKIRKLEQ